MLSRAASQSSDRVPRASGDGPQFALHAVRVAERVPRASGDGPIGSQVMRASGPCSPRERGWTGRHQEARSAEPRVPRASGDGPRTGHRQRTDGRCSPRERGWTGSDGGGQLRKSRVPRASGDGPEYWPAGLRKQGVFPARAGMDRRSTTSSTTTPRCSPRERGWTANRSRSPTPVHVFPARAGMDRPRPAASTA